VAGLRAHGIGRIAFPRNSQWLSDASARIYRCGGSRGIGSFSPEPHLFPVSLDEENASSGTSDECADINRRVVAMRLWRVLPTFESTLRLKRYALTHQDFSHYSVSMNAAMVPELEALEEKIRQAASLCLRLREENRGLRAKLATLEGDRRHLEEKIDDARTRLENLLKQIPE
jgi:cell division protein ZapB